MYGNSGWDRFIEFQYQFTGDFYTLLFRTIAQADGKNLQRLGMGFPEEVHAYKLWTQEGQEAFACHVTAGHPLLRNLVAEMKHECPDILTDFMAEATKAVMGDPEEQTGKEP